MAGSLWLPEGHIPRPFYHKQSFTYLLIGSKLKLTRGFNQAIMGFTRPS